ncbi:MAG: type IV secretory system conjugative DNA transfer family protein [Candidatus Melainabacteria bacterium]|nr:type IV secretory system conjugative DNA transfer family protein [Candidatus Melainabacteria bacterium]
MSEALGRLLTSIPENEVAKVIATSLRSLGYDGLFVNEQYRTITASRREPFKTTNFNAVLDFAVSIEWADYSDDIGPGILINTKVTERQASWSGSNCQQKLEAIEDSIGKYAKQIELGAGGPKVTGARWASIKELRLAEYLGSMASHGQLFLGYLDSEYLRLPEGETNRHCLVCGPTGSGKTTGIFIPNLIERSRSSAIVTEATGGKGVADLYRKTAGYRKNQGHKIYYFNPDDLSSHRINPLDRVRTFRDAWRVVEVIMLATTASQARVEQTWDTAERLLFAALVMHAVGERADGNCNLGYILELLGQGSEAISDRMVTTKIPAARRFFQAFWTNSTDKYRNLVAAGLLSRLALWNQPRIKELTSTTDVDVSRLSEELFTWYIAVPADKPELKPLASLIFNLAISYVYEGEFVNPVMLMLDEFTNFGYIKGLPQKLTILRHDKIPVVLGVQDLVQIENLYGKDSTILRNQCATRFYFKPNGSETALVISRDLGMYSKEETTVTSAGHLQTRTEKLPLMSPDEILNMGVIDEGTYSANSGPLRPQVLIALPSTRPIRIEACTYQDYLEQTNYPVPERAALTASEDLIPSYANASDYIEQLSEPVQQMEAVLDAIAESTSASLAGGSSAKPEYPPMWYVPIVINCLVDGVVENRVYRPDSSLVHLEELMIEYEAGDKVVCDSLTELEVAKLAAWLEKSAEQEAIGERDEKQRDIGAPGPVSQAEQLVVEQPAGDASVLVAEAQVVEVPDPVEQSAVPSEEIIDDDKEQNQAHQGTETESEKDIDSELDSGLDLGILWG